MSENLIEAVISETPSSSSSPVTIERPSWLPEKFKTGEDLVKSYSELEKRMGVIPEEYDLSNSVFLDPEKDVIKDFLNVAKEKRVPKEVVDKLVESMDRYLGEYDTDINVEVTKLGDNAKDRLVTLDNWAKANLSESSYKALINNLQSADAIHALEELRGKMMSNQTMVPGGNGGDNHEIETIDKIKQEIVDNYAQYKTDEKYRKNIEGRLNLVAKTSGMIDKVGA
jgi:hypothetical protein